MATSTFERKIEISSPEALERLAEVMASDPPSKTISDHPYRAGDRERCDALLRQWSSRLKR